MGLAKLRVTGGEPFARKDCARFMGDLRAAFPDLRLSLTSNGALIGPYIPLLAKLRLDSVNLSLDSFREATYAKVTGSDAFNVVIKNLDALLMRGLRVKINAVALKGVTDTQMDEFVAAAKFYGVEIRFIELMPMGEGQDMSGGSFIAAGDLLARARSLVSLKELARNDPHAGPARVYEIAGSGGKLGFISAISSHFCRTCNRLRVTSDGNLRPCLFSEKEYKLASLLRKSAFSDEALAKVARLAAARKPLGAEELAHRDRTRGKKRHIGAIGG